ncbi:unnamed protein product [Caenorhabditis auriculariae]|uniref:Ribosomal RNA-processing protein 42 n=1 Tax=Caenorhabditis auriculariae TaxID=2777116 RepID=A0A8S1H887_9PELO|nr:unnamed protein product [Caenorhabditis auriculariae]
MSWLKIVSPLNFFVDFSANASSHFAGKGGDSFAEELTAALRLAYANVTDLIPSIRKMILSNRQRWKINVDVTVIGALSDLSIPEVDVVPDDGGRSSLNLRRLRTGDDIRDEDLPVITWQLEVLKCPILVSVSKIGTANVLDCTPEEESCIRSQLWIGVATSDSEDVVVTMVKHVGGGFLEMESISDMLDVAVRASRTLRTSIEDRLQQEQPRRPGYTFLL